MNTITSAPLRTLVAGAILSALTFSIATVSRADDGTTPPQVIVKFGDLNISSSQGAAALYARIKSAAEKVCSPYDRSGLEAKTRLNACIDKAILGAVTKVNAPALSAVYSAKTGKEVPTRQLAAR